MICTDPRIVDICTDLFRFLKSDLTETTIHTKKCQKIDKKTVIQTEIDIGFLTIRMVWKPYNVQNSFETGSDEGANLFIYLPFKESAKDPNSNQFMIRGYYSERGTDKRINISVQNEFISSQFGPKRIVHDLNVIQGNPL